MAEANAPYNAPLWAVRSPQEISWFRVQVDGAGRILSTSVFEFNRSEGSPDLDAQVRSRLRQRYGDETTITVIADGGESYEYFWRELHAGRSPVPPAADAPAHPLAEGQHQRWEDPPQRSASPVIEITAGVLRRRQTPSLAAPSLTVVTRRTPEPPHQERKGARP